MVGILALPAVASVMWTALAAAAHPIVQSVPVPSEAIAVSADGHVATFGTDRVLRIWELSSRTLVRRIAVQDGIVHPIELAWDDATHEVYLARGEGTLAFDLEGRARRIQRNASERLRAVPGGQATRWFVGELGRWELRDGAGVTLGKLPGGAGEIAVAGNGKLAVAVLGTQLVLYAIDSLQQLQTLQLPDPVISGSWYDHATSSIAVSRDGSSAALCLKAGNVGAIDLVRGFGRSLARGPARTRVSVPKLGSCYQVALVDEYRMVIVSDGGGGLCGVDLATGAVAWQFDVHSPGTPLIAQSMQLALHGRTVLATMPDGRTRLFDVVRGDVVGELGSPIVPALSMAFSGDDELLVSRRPDERWSLAAARMNSTTPLIRWTAPTTTWSLKDGTASLRDRVTSTRTARDGIEWDYSHVGEDRTLTAARRLPTAPAADLCWEFLVGTIAARALPEEVERDRAAPAAIARSSLCVPAGSAIAGVDARHRRILTGDRGSETVYSEDRRPVALTAVGGGILGMVLAFSEDGNWVLGHNTTGVAGVLYVWDVTTGCKQWFSASPQDPEAMTIVIGGPPAVRKGFSAAALSQDGSRITVGAGDTVTVYRTRDKAVLWTVPVTGAGDVTAVELLPDGGVVAGTDDGALIVAHAGQRPVVGRGAAGKVQRIVVRRDARRIATLSDDGAIGVWHPDATLAVSLFELSDGAHFAVTPGGAYAGPRESIARVNWVFDAPTEAFGYERFAASIVRPDIVAKRLAGDPGDLADVTVRPPRVSLVTQPPRSARRSVKITAHVEGAARITDLRAFVDGRPAASA